ncbi:MAG: ATP-binding protein [Lachnospiraceae bacterium]|nr:ATP-binding protein [Lachnospiraceae bacterium]
MSEFLVRWCPALAVSATEIFCALAFVWEVRRGYMAVRIPLGAVLVFLANIALMLTEITGFPAYAGALVFRYTVVLLLVLLLADAGAFETVYLSIWSFCLSQFLPRMWVVLYTAAMNTEEVGWMAWLLCLLCAAFFLFPVYRLVVRPMSRNGVLHVGPRQTGSAVVILLLFGNLYLNEIAGNSVLPGDSGNMLLLCEFYCLTLLYLQNILFQKSAMRQELAMINRLWYQRKEQYELNQENISLINQKCHDLKYQVRALRDIQGGAERERYLDEIDGAIQIYESNFETGSQVLDTILTENSLRCRKENIQIHCVADGEEMEFMNAVDLYTILGNAVDNAVEAVRKFSDPAKRQIDLLIHRQQSFLVMNISNPCEEELHYKDNLPVTTKENNGYHGFGLKSIRHTVSRYGGFMTAGTQQGCFELIILIQLPKENIDR